MKKALKITSIICGVVFLMAKSFVFGFGVGFGAGSELEHATNITFESAINDSAAEGNIKNTCIRAGRLATKCAENLGIVKRR